MSCPAVWPPWPAVCRRSDPATSPADTDAQRAMLPTEGLVQSAVGAEHSQGFVEYYFSNVKVSSGICRFVRTEAGRYTGFRP